MKDHRSFDSFERGMILGSGSVLGELRVDVGGGQR